MVKNADLALNEIGGETLQGSGFELEPESPPPEDEETARSGGGR